MGSDPAPAEDEFEDTGAPIPRRGPRIREEEVHKIADQLLLDGHRPSVERIRAKLGRGSPNTVALFLDRWWSQLGARLRDLPGQDLPPVPPNVASAMHALWTQAIDHARALLHESFDQQSALLTKEREELITNLAQLARDREDLAREREALLQSVTLARAQLEEANERHRLDMQQITDLQEERLRLQTTIEKARSDQEALAIRLEGALRQHQDDVRALNERLEATERHWLKQVDEARQALTAERRATQALEKQLASERDMHSERMREATAQLATTRAELARTQEQLTVSQQQNGKLERTLTEQVERADRAARAANDAQAQANKQIAGLQTQLQELSAQLVQLTTKLTQRPAAGARER